VNDPVLVPCLVVLRQEFNTLSPGRDKRSDGWIGDRSHAASSSDHNPDETGNTPYEDADDVDEVHGLDVDETGPWPGGPQVFDYAVDEVVKRHRLGLDDRLQNVIRNGRIASRSWGWTWRDYTGPNGHYEHAHFSARYTSSHENDRRPFGVLARFLPAPSPAQEEIPMNQAEFNELMDSWARSATGRAALGDALIDAKIGDPDIPSRTVGQRLVDDAAVRAVLVNPSGPDAKRISNNAPIRNLISHATPAPATPAKSAPAAAAKPRA